jgi:uncharacterized membrane protein YfcA
MSHAFRISSSRRNRFYLRGRTVDFRHRLLVFGTPALLLAGYPFEQALAYVLPCSVAVNLMQIIVDWDKISLKRDFAYFCLPLVVAGLSFTLWLGHAINIKAGVGALMVMTAVLRASPGMRQELQATMRRHSRPALAAIGIIHGLTNMGGGLLSLFVSSFEDAKTRIRATIALGYLLMAVTQIAILATHHQTHIGGDNLTLVGIAALTYCLIGNRLFLIASEQRYQHILTAFITTFGLVLMF